jgi:hypothetical protein
MDYIPIILILCGLVVLETCGWLRTLYKQWQREQNPLYGRDGKYVRGGR